jgi:hypothetical protein
MTTTLTPEAPLIHGRTWLDAMQVPIELGDRVMVTGLGGGTTVAELRRVFKAIDYGRTRVKLREDVPPGTVAGPYRMRPPAALTVLARDGGDGFEGNRLRELAKMPTAPIMAEHMEAACALAAATELRGTPFLIQKVAQAIADAELRGAASTHNDDVRQAAQRVGRFLAAREQMSGQDPVEVIGVWVGERYQLTVADLSTLAGLG